MGAESFVKKEIAAPVHIIVVFFFKFFFKYSPKISCFPPPMFVRIKSGLIFSNLFKSFLSENFLILYSG